jgi:50S ribosomal protein L16 3-hydroxylase
VATDECLSFSIGFRAATHAEMLQDFVEHISRGLPAAATFRSPNLVVQQHANEITAATIDTVMDVLTDYLRPDHPELPRWFGRFISDVKTDITSGVGQTAADFRQLVTSHDVLARHPASHFAFSRRDSRALLFIDGDDFDVSVGFAEALCAHRQVDVQLLAGIMTAEEQQLFLDLFNSGKLSPSF